MKNNIFFVTAGKSVLLGGAALLGALTFGVNQMRAEEHVAVEVKAGVTVQDEYDYYPAYETYYNRRTHEYVYRDGDNWVRRSEPRGVKAEVLLRAPVVRMDFHDGPEHHHEVVVKSYPKTWTKDYDHDRDHDDKRDHDHDDKR